MPESVRSPLPDGDAEIVRLLRERHSTGLRELLQRYGAITQRALKKALGTGLDDAEIDEAMSTASYNAWRAINTYDPGKGTLRSWFFVIARNAGRVILRERQQRQWEPQGDAMALMAAKATPDLDDVGHGHNRHDDNRDDANSYRSTGDNSKTGRKDQAPQTGRSQNASGGDAAGDNTSDLASTGKQATLLAALRNCIERLPRLQRCVIEADLKTGDVAEAGELARELSTSKNSIYVSRSTARKTLSRKLGELGFSLGRTQP